jgi:hypothetical protein
MLVLESRGWFALVVPPNLKRCATPPRHYKLGVICECLGDFVFAQRAARPFVFGSRVVETQLVKRTLKK